MPHYEVSGKWSHLSYSHGFSEVVIARTPRAALLKFAQQRDGYEEPDDISWDYLPARLTAGQTDPEPTFWFGGDQMYKIRHVAQVRPAVVVCPECEGRGQIPGFVPAN